MSKLYFLLILTLGISSAIQSQKDSTTTLKAPESILKTIQAFPLPIIIDPTLSRIQHRIKHTIRYYDCFGQTRETILYFNSKGCLIARSRGPWIRAIMPTEPERTVYTIYSILNPAPSFFYSDNYDKHYYYNALKKKSELLIYNRLKCPHEGRLGVGIPSIQGTKYAFLNKKRKPICDFIYDAIGSFHKGIVIVKRADKEGVLNRMGKEIIPCNYIYIKVLEANRIEGLREDRGVDIFNKKGKLL